MASWVQAWERQGLGDSCRYEAVMALACGSRFGSWLVGAMGMAGQSWIQDIIINLGSICPHLWNEE